MSVFSPLPLSPCRFVLLVLAASLAYSSSLPPTRHRTSDLSVLNLTSANGTAPSSHLDAVDNDIWSWFCTRSPGWSSPALNPDDCTGVLDYFFVEALYDGGKGIMEFRAPGAKVSGDVKTQWTPRKYTFGTCTLAIVMVMDFPDPASLPGGFKVGPDADRSTYYNIWTIAENLVHQCVIRRGEMGWQPTGLWHGIGVFIWATGSYEDLAIEADEPRFTIPVGDVLRNGSVASV